MIPIIYPSNETQFQNNGLGRLPDCISCRVTEERNGVFELELVYPITGHNYDLIQIGRIIYTTHDATKTPQPFDIYKRSVPIDGHVTFSAHHISYRLNGMVVSPFTVTGAAGAALAALGSHSITSCPFTFTSDRTTSLTYTVSKPETIRRLLGGVEGSILDIYGGGDYTFNKFNVTYGTRGTDNGVTIRYGKQMTDIDAEHSTEGTYNAVVPFWSNDTTMVTLPEWYVSNGTPEALAVLDLSSEWQEAPTAAQLRAKAQERLTNGKPWEPDENIEVSFIVQPEDYEGIENLQRVVLCDVVTIAYPAAGVSAKIRVIKIEYNPLTESYNSVELGTPQTSLAQTITEKAVSDTLKQTITAGFMNQAIQTATDLIAGGLGGHVVIGRNADGEPEEILIMDTDDVQTAVNVIRMNQAGIGFSTDGYDGPFISAWTIDGTFNTAFIQVAALSVLSANAGTITAGVLRSSDYSYTSGTYTTSGMIIDLDNKIIRTPKTAILSDGSIYSSSVDLEGKITATSGKIGGWEIDNNSLLYDKTEPITGGTLRQYTELDYFAVSGFSGKNAGTYEQSGYVLYSSGVAEIYTIDTSVDYAPRLDVYQRFGTRQRGTEVNAGGVRFYDIGGTTEYNFTLSKDVKNAVTNITRSGTTFTATQLDGSTFTFTQQDNNTTYTAGTGLTLSSNQFSVSAANASAILNLLGTGSSTPVDADYYISQYVGGGTTTTTYHRRPMSALWAYIQGKADSRYLKLTGGTLTGDLYVGQTSDTTLHAVIVRNSAGNAQLHVGASGNHGLYSGTKRDWIIYCNPDDNSTNSWAYMPRPLNVAGHIHSSNEIRSGGKWTSQDGHAGCILSGGGHLYLQQGTSGSNIYFIWGAGTTITSRIYESASGTLTVSGNLTAGGNLTTSTTSTSVERAVTVATGNVSGAVRANNGGTGGAFGLYATKTGNTARNKWLVWMNSSGTITHETSSDLRDKNVLGEISEQEAINVLRQVKIINYIYKNDEESVVQNGVVAQQVRDVLLKNNLGYRPYISIHGEDGNSFYYDLKTPEDEVRYGIDYSKFTPILWKGWQLHDDRIAALENENADLRAEIAKMKGAA